MVEIARAVYNKARIIIFDEPTASLTPEEIVHFFNLVRDLRARGVGDHLHLPRARGIAADLRPHHRAARRQAGDHRADQPEMTREKLVRSWSGATSAQTHYCAQGRSRGAPQARREKVLTVENVTMGTVVKNMSFSVYAGEVVGIAGLDRLRPHRDRQDHLRRAEAQPDQWRHHQAARQADPLPRAEAGDQRRHRLHHRRPQAERLLRDHGRRRQRLYRQARDQGGLALPAVAGACAASSPTTGSSG